MRASSTLLVTAVLACAAALSGAQTDDLASGRAHDDGIASLERLTWRAQSALAELRGRIEDDRPDAVAALAKLRLAQGLLGEVGSLLELNAVSGGVFTVEALFLEVEPARGTWIEPMWRKLGKTASFLALDTENPFAGEDLRRFKALGDVIAAPKMHVIEGQQAVAEVGSSNEMPVLRERAPGTYELEMERFWDGIRLAITVKTNDEGEIVADVRPKVSCIVGRMPVEADAKVIGAPMMRVVTTQLDIVMKPGSAVLVRLPGEDGPSSIGIVLRVSPRELGRKSPGRGR